MSAADTTRSARPYSRRTGTGRAGTQAPRSSAPATGAIAAIRAASAQPRRFAKKPPLDMPVAKARRRSTQRSSSSRSTSARTKSTPCVSPPRMSQPRPVVPTTATPAWPSGWPAVTPSRRPRWRAGSAPSARRRALLGDQRDVLLGGALQAVAQHAGEIQEHLGGDARVAQLDAAEEALVDGQHLEVTARHHVGAPLGVTHETHLAEDVAAPVLGDALPLLTAARPHLG